MSIRTPSLALTLLFYLAIAGAQHNPFVGTWKLNASKSEFHDSPRTSQTTIIVESEGGLKSSTEVVYDDGQSLHTEWTAKLDGSPTELTGDSHYDSIVVKKINDRTLDVISKKGSRIGRTSRWVVSPDGKTMTRTQNVVTETGEYLENVIVFEKQ